MKSHTDHTSLQEKGVPNQLPWLLLGSGGRTPRVERFDTTSSELRVLLSLSAGHSTYSLAESPDGSLLAVGTKSGPIKIIDLLHINGPAQEDRGQTLDHSTPILTVAFTESTVILACDLSGRCLSWDISLGDPSPKVFHSSNDRVCSLYSLSTRKVYGLTKSGRLIEWRFPAGDLVKEFPVPVPPPLHALVNLLHWKTKRKLTYPGENGRLVFFDLEKEHCSTISAHSGEFYAVTLVGENLITLGMKDGRLRTWNDSLKEPEEEIQVGDGFVSAETIACEPPKLLLIHRTGKASIHEFTKGGIRLQSEIPGEDFRVARCLSLKQAPLSRTEDSKTTIHLLVKEIQELCLRGAIEESDKKHKELISRGYEHVSLCLRAEKAQRDGKLVEELQIRKKLATLLPPGDPRSLKSLERLAEVLASVWQFEEARSVCQTILAIKPDPAISERIQALTEFIDAMSRDSWLAQPSIPLPTVLSCATVLDKFFLGTWVVKSGSLWDCQDSSLSVDDITKKYNQCRNTVPGKAIPEGYCESFHWLSAKSSELTQIMTVESPFRDATNVLKFALRSSQDDFRTIFMPMLVLASVEDERTSVTPVEHNETAVRLLDTVAESKALVLWLEPVERFVTKAIRMLISETSPLHFSI